MRANRKVLLVTQSRDRQMTLSRPRVLSLFRISSIKGSNGAQTTSDYSKQDNWSDWIGNGRENRKDKF